MQYQIKVNMEELYRKIVLGLFLSLVFVGCKQTTDMLEVKLQDSARANSDVCLLVLDSRKYFRRRSRERFICHETSRN